MAVLKNETMSQKILAPTKAIGLVLVLLFVGTAALAVNSWSKSLLPARTIIVSGEGRAILVPDIATISLSVISEGKNPVDLQKDNNEKINKSLEFLKNLGINPKDIKTSGYNLSPKYEYDEKKRKSFIDGYNLTQTVTVKVRDLNKVADILSELPGLGVNQIGGPDFSVDDIQKNLKEARAEAFKNAWEKASQLAELNNVGLGRVITFSEEGGFSSMPVFFSKEMAVGGADGIRPDIEPGSEDVRVRVSVTFEIR